MTSKLNRVLIVDDEVDACLSLRDILEDLGYEVAVAHTARDAIDLVRQNPFDVAVLDLKMPDTDGLRLYHAIKEVRADTVAIVLTAYATTETARRALDAGAWQVLSKPTDVPLLMQLIQRALTQPLLLVVDDDHEFCESLWDLLRGQGYRVALAHSVAEAANQLTDRRYRVVMIDMRLVNGSGREVLKLVQEHEPDTRTILITGFRTELDALVQDALKEGANAVCYKPFDVSRLLKCIQDLAATHGA